MSGYDHRPERGDTDVIGARILALIFDSIIGTVLFFGIMFVFFFIGAAGSQASETAGGSIILFGILAAFLVSMGYFLLLEGLWDGYTLGKKLMGIKVVKEDGSECGLGASILRNLLRIIDYLPFYYLLGFIVMAMSDKRQRVGDRAAGTVVVRE